MQSKKTFAVVASLVLIVTLAFPAQSVPITYNFDDGTLQGWTTVSSDPGNYPDPEMFQSSTAYTAQGGSGKSVWCAATGGTQNNNRDKAHKPLWIRSPEFKIDQAGSITLWLLSGSGAGLTTGILPTNASQIPLGVDSTASGLMGVALRDTANGDFVLTGQKSAPSWDTWEQITLNVSSLINDGKTYTLELFDYRGASSSPAYSSIGMDTVSIPGTLAGTTPHPFVDITNGTDSITVVGVTSYALAGTNIYTVGNLWWTNKTTRTSGSVTPSGGAWGFTVDLANGPNVIGVAGSNSVGSIYEDVVTIIVAGPPAITNDAPSNVGTNYARACANLTATNFAPTTVKLYYGPTDGGTDPNNWGTAVNLGVKAQGSITYLITNITEAICYRYYATNAAGESWCDVATTITPAPPFNPTDYAKVLTIVLSGYTGAETLTNFPALVKLGAYITGFSYDEFKSGNNDLRFTDINNAELNYEIDTWNTNAGGSSLLWVQVPALQGSTTQIRMYYGKAGDSAPMYTVDGSVWSENYVAVWHMETNAVRNSVSAQWNATAVNNAAYITNCTGKFGIAQDFRGDAAAAYAAVGNLCLTQQTLSAWVWLDNANREGCFMSKDGVMYFWQQGIAIRFETANWGGDTTYGVPPVGQWHYVVATAGGDGTAQAIYSNGVRVATWTKGNVPSQNSTDFRLGSAGGGRNHDGRLDECRVANVARSYDWIKAEYDNQNAPQTFGMYTMGILAAPLPYVDITNIASAVAVAGVASYVIAGTNNEYTVGAIWWTNQLNGAHGIEPASSTGWSFSTDLGLGDNVIVVSGTNIEGIASTDQATIYLVELGVTNRAATLATDNAATANGWLSISAPSVPTTVIAYYGTNDGGMVKEDWQASTVVGASMPNGGFSTTLQNLASNTTYYYTFLASNAVEEVWASNGATMFKTPAALLKYTFDDGTLQGWTTVSSDPDNAPDPTNFVSSSGYPGQGDSARLVCYSPLGHSDNPHKTLLIRSPKFKIDQAGSLTLWLLFGTGNGGWPGDLATLPTNASQIPLGVDSTSSGMMGVALRDTANGEFVRTGQRSYSAWEPQYWEQITWDVSDLVNNGKTYTVELFDYLSGKAYSSLAMDTVSIPGALVSETPADPGDVELLGIGRGGAYGQMSLSWSNNNVVVLACTNRFYSTDMSSWFVLANGVTSPWTHVAATNFAAVYYRIVSGPYTSAYDVGKFDVDIAAGSISWLSFPFAPQPACDKLSDWFGQQLLARDYSSYAYPLLQVQNGIGGSIITRSYYVDTFGEATTNWWPTDDPIVQNAGYVLFLAPDHPAVKLTSLGMVPTNGVTLAVPYQTIPWIGLSYPASVNMRDSGVANLFNPPQLYSLFNYDFVDSQQTAGGSVWYAEYFIDDWGGGTTNFFIDVAGADRIDGGKGYLLFFSTTRTETGTWNYVRPY